MKNARIILSKLAHSQRVKSFRTNAALILVTLMLLIAAATTAASAQTYSVVYNFGDRLGHPQDILAQGRDGNLYGTSGYGCGAVYRITPGGALRRLHQFNCGIEGVPTSGLTLGTSGNFYGTTANGGANNLGTIFKITASGGLTTLYSFTGGADGLWPLAVPIQGTDGNFYGTTSDFPYEGFGTAYKITPSGTFTLLGSLPGGSYAPLLQATDGTFYGTTEYDGHGLGMGTVFEMTANGIVTTVYNFDGTHGSYPYAPVIQGNDGNFYGTTSYGGSYVGGVVFKLTPQGAITVLHNFDPNSGDGYNPTVGLVQATDGNFYGVTWYGGTGACGSGCGVIFQITPAGAYSILYNFHGVHGTYPLSAPMQHSNGKIYGLTSLGGDHNSGVVYSLDMGLGPFVSLLSTTGKIGKTVEILGQGFTGTTAVSFNGTAATFTIKSDTYLKATVPPGATTGFVTVTPPTGTLTSNKPFRVKP